MNLPNKPGTSPSNSGLLFLCSSTNMLAFRKKHFPINTCLPVHPQNIYLHLLACLSVPTKLHTQTLIKPVHPQSTNSPTKPSTLVQKHFSTYLQKHSRSTHLHTTKALTYIRKKHSPKYVPTHKELTRTYPPVRPPTKPPALPVVGATAG
jgi:hypothetical protein